MNLRAQMPFTAQVIDELRAVFGAEGIDAAIRAGIKGQADRFHAIEAGLEIGTKFNWGEAGEDGVGSPVGR